MCPGCFVALILAWWKGSHNKCIFKLIYECKEIELGTYLLDIAFVETVNDSYVSFLGQQNTVIPKDVLEYVCTRSGLKCPYWASLQLYYMQLCLANTLGQTLYFSVCFWRACRSTASWLVTTPDDCPAFRRILLDFPAMSRQQCCPNCFLIWGDLSFGNGW